MKNLPEKIYLQVCGDQECDTCTDVCDFNQYKNCEISWSEDRINDSDIEYSLVKL